MLIDFPLALVKKLLQLWLLQKKNFCKGHTFFSKGEKVIFCASVFNVIAQLYRIVMVDFG